jgi:hypothetical protein
MRWANAVEQMSPSVDMTTKVEQIAPSVTLTTIGITAYR